MRCDQGSIAVPTVFCLIALMAVGAFALELSNAYLQSLHLQRVADLSVLAAAASGDPIHGGRLDPAAVAAGRSLAASNGLAPEKLQIEAAASPLGDGAMAIKARIAEEAKLGLASFVRSNAVLPVAAEAWAGVRSSNVGDCLQSLVGPTNIYNSAVAGGPGCKLRAATYFYACHKAKVILRAASVKYKARQEAPYLCAPANVTLDKAAFDYGVASTDPFANDERLLAIKTRLARMRSPGWPYGHQQPAKLLDPEVPKGADGAFAGATATIEAASHYGNLAVASSTLTFSGGGADPTCRTPTTIAGNLILTGDNRLVLGAGCYVIGGYIDATDSTRTSFEAAPGAQITFVVKKYIRNGAGRLIFPDGTYSIHGDVDNGAPGMMSFGDGDMVFGAGIKNGAMTLAFGDGIHTLDGGTVTNGLGTLTFGSGAFRLWGGSLANASTGTIRFGDGPFLFYGGTVTNVGGVMSFGRGPFAFKGGSLSLDANSTTSFGVGDLDFYGGSASFGGRAVTLGAGGSAETGGSSVFFSGGSFSLPTGTLTAIGTTFAFDGGTTSFYGPGAMTMTAPFANAPRYGYRDILIVVQGGAFNLHKSAPVTDTLSGLIYVPRTNASIYGKGSVVRPEKGCLQIVAGILDIYQYAALDMQSCGSRSPSASRPRLIQ
ncbi:hypothetical protein GCM10011390_07870 [Aureimonas endophytica]|uniref:Putative Flp pilus-assembly TadG-like N-terminal domain-containing protein n=1 Tax=Aureimonas endophytica TaxID=2027858 RepID=A0A916ZDY6_9HYPH|nr:Tad domain-containing protein [Aureimonas endophytica]GGD91499.1 hypothetical protein GCM10011390_07870 [Aureimonas endophytica]